MEKLSQEFLFVATGAEPKMPYHRLSFIMRHFHGWIIFQLLISVIPIRFCCCSMSRRCAASSHASCAWQRVSDLCVRACAWRCVLCGTACGAARCRATCTTRVVGVLGAPDTCEASATMVVVLDAMASTRGTHRWMYSSGSAHELSSQWHVRRRHRHTWPLAARRGSAQTSPREPRPIVV